MVKYLVFTLFVLNCGFGHETYMPDLTILPSKSTGLNNRQKTELILLLLNKDKLYPQNIQNSPVSIPTVNLPEKNDPVSSDKPCKKKKVHKHCPKKDRFIDDDPDRDSEDSEDSDEGEEEDY